VKRSISTIALSAFALSAASLGFARAENAPPAPLPSASATAAPQVTPTPILPPGALPSPAANTASVTIGPKKPKATPAPPKDEDANRVGLTGVWEVALQKTDGVVYTHFKLVQTGTSLTGQYLDENGKKYPLAGSIDGKNVRVVVSMPNGTALVFSGSQDAMTDMMGTVSTSKDLIGFTAAYRPKEKWIDNISPGGSGLGSAVGNPGGTP
jgi:hypothetical protein